MGRFDLGPHLAELQPGNGPRIQRPDPRARRKTVRGRCPRLPVASALLGALAVAGCAHLGPKTIAVDRFDYSAAIADSWKQQTLLNIVKLRYLDLPVFVDVASIVSGYSLLKLAPDQQKYVLTYSPVRGAEGELAVNSRSMMQILCAFASYVDVPKEHERRAVRVSDDALAETRQDVVRIHSSREKPPDAFAAVFYRGYWFWIDDGDWQTKRALTAVMFFFTLEGTGGAEKLPLVTIPAQ
jgi:hypothetical protein